MKMVKMVPEQGFTVALLLICSFGKGAIGAGHTSDLVKAITYNIAGFDFSPEPGLVANNREQRLDATIDALRNSDADLICLQEAWIAQDLEKIVQELADVYTYSYSQLHNSADGTLPPQTNIVQNAVCDRTANDLLINCSIAAGCTNPSDPQQEVGCSAANCQGEFFAVLLQGQQCVSCISISSESQALANTRCSSESEPTTNPRTMNTLGLALLSKRPLSNMQTHKFYNVTLFFDKGYISARFNGDLEVVCNHLTSVTSNFVEPLNAQYFPTAASQNLFEVDVLTTKYRNVAPLLFLGDMNSADAFTNTLTAILPEAYHKLRRGFETTVRPLQCTFCSSNENPYNVGDANQAIDFIFGNGILIRSAKVVFKLGDVNVTDGQGNMYPLSDHYGFEADFRYPCLKFDPFLQSSSISNTLL